MCLNNKGFTMVELIVVMAIMGLLVIMAFPTIRAIQTNNVNKKYEEYGKSAISAAKLYVDSYGEDIFDPTKSSQKYQLNFDDLVKKDLLKDINISDSTCITGRSNVWVVKYNDDYTYCLHLYCKIKGTDDSTAPLYESQDKVGSCKDITSKIKNVKYIYNDGTRNLEYDDEIIDGDDNYRIVSISRTGFDFNSNHDVFLKWVDENGREYDQNTIYDKKATGSTVFKAKTRKWNYYIYFNKNDESYSGTMTPNPQKCSYGSECKLNANPYDKEGHTFKHWKSGSSTDTYSNGEDVITKIGNNIPVDGARYDLTAIFRKNICSVKYNTNGGNLINPHSSVISQSGNNILVNGKEVHHEVEYGDKLGTSGLNDWNNKTYINLSKTGYGIFYNKEWNTKNNGSGTTFNQTSQYAGTTLCSDLKDGDQEVTMYPKWVKEYTITLSVGGNNQGWINYHGNNVTSIVAKEGEKISFSAISYDYSQFTGWSDGDSSKTKTITVTKDLTLTASFRYNIGYNYYHANGGHLIPGVSQYCPDFAGCKYFCNPGVNCDGHEDDHCAIRVNDSGCVGTKDVVFKDGKLYYYRLLDLRDFRGWGGSLRMDKDGTRISQIYGYWNVGSSNSSVNYREDAEGNFYTELGMFEYFDRLLGTHKARDFKTQDVEIHFYANWYKR